jgi:FMN reductase
MTAISQTINEVVEQTLVLARSEAPLRAVAISGSPLAPSKSKLLAERFLDALEKLGCETRLVDLALMPAPALVAREQSPEIDAAVAAVGQAQIIAASTPTYRALYTGVLKCFFDLMPQAHLAGKVCVGLQTGIAPQHALSPDYGLRLLFASLGGIPALTIYAVDAEFESGESSDALAERVRRSAAQAIQLARGLGPGEA